MAETLKTIASSTAKLRELLAESKRDLHRIQLLLDALDEGLKSLWPYDNATASSKDLVTQTTTTSISTSKNSTTTAFQNITGSDVDDNEYIAPQLASNASLWKETVALVSSSRIVGIAAQADDALAGTGTASENVRQRAWFADGKLYSRWIGRGAVWMLSSRTPSPAGELAQVLERVEGPLVGNGMSIGYRDDIVEEITRLMIFDDHKSIPKYISLLIALKPWEQRYFLASLLGYFAKLLNQTHSAATGPSKTASLNGGDSHLKSQADAIPAVASLLRSIMDAVPGFQSQEIETLTGNPQSMLLSRAVLAALSNSARGEVLEKTWSQFSDPLQIRNVAVMSQEANARILLVAAGYVSRQDPSRVLNLARSSMHGNAISERLKNSSERVRWLGMCVGMAISGLVDEKGKIMDFGVEDVQTEEAKILRTLVAIDDKPGDANELQRFYGSNSGTGKPSLHSASLKSPKSKESNQSRSQQSKSKIIEIVDISEEEDDDDDLKPYAKPDSDEPDSDEDATLVNRNKPKAPVYIRDLISALADTENEARYILALRTAASLIRRKATFGSELHDRITELAQSLVSLQDHFDTEDFHELKQESITALIVANPKLVGPWMIKHLFEGDLSVSQRVAIVVALGIGGRELAGFKTPTTGETIVNDTDRVAASKQGQQQAWPSKILPGQLHDLYSENSNTRTLITPKGSIHSSLKGQERTLQVQSQKIEGITRQMETTMLNPINTREWSKPRPRTRMLKNDLTAIVANSFFFPLTRYWQAYSQASKTQIRNPLDEPLLTALTLKTLTLLLLAAGPSAPSLPQTTKEMLALLLSLRSKASRHQPVLEGILFALVTILDLHGVGVEGGPSTSSSSGVGPRWLAEDCGKEIVELREWVGGVWEKIENAGGVTLNLGEASMNENKGGDEETDRCRVLAAKVLVGINEIVESYQRLLVGELSRV